MYYIYVLQSLRDGRTYVGFTDNVERRLNEHNAGRSKATKYRCPFKLLFTEIFDTASDAKRRERWWKSGSGRRKLKEYFEAGRNDHDAGSSSSITKSMRVASREICG